MIAIFCCVVLFFVSSLACWFGNTQFHCVVLLIYTMYKSLILAATTALALGEEYPPVPVSLDYESQ